MLGGVGGPESTRQKNPATRNWLSLSWATRMRPVGSGLPYGAIVAGRSVRHLRVPRLRTQGLRHFALFLGHGLQLAFEIEARDLRAAWGRSTGSSWPTESGTPRGVSCAGVGVVHAEGRKADGLKAERREEKAGVGGAPPVSGTNSAIVVAVIEFAAPSNTRRGCSGKCPAPRYRAPAPPLSRWGSHCPWGRRSRSCRERRA